jgi:hypothetical protein
MALKSKRNGSKVPRVRLWRTRQSCGKRLWLKFENWANPLMANGFCRFRKNAIVVAADSGKVENSARNSAEFRSIQALVRHVGGTSRSPFHVEQLRQL